MINNVRTSVLFGLLLLASTARSQEFYTGIHMDNYAGMTAVGIQPAEIVDNRFKLFIGASLSYQASNNYRAANFNNLWDILGFGGLGNQQQAYRDHNGRGYGSEHFKLDLFNGMFEINHKNSIGYSISFNNYRITDGLPSLYTQAEFDDFQANPAGAFDFKRLLFQRFTYFSHNWYYGRVLKEDNEHYFKAGAAFRVINGLNAEALYAKNGTFEFDATVGGGMNFISDEVKLGDANNANSLDNRSAGVGFDIGLVYEFRPEYDSFKYDMDGKKDIERYDKNRYKLKLGASLVDIGRVKFEKETNSYDFATDPNGIIIDGNVLEDANDLNNTPFDYFNTNLAGEPSSTQLGSNKSTFNMSLPTALNLQADYHIWNGFYAAYTGSIPLGIPGDGSRVWNPTTHTITPRYEHKVFSIMTPFTIKRNGQFNFGIAGRLTAGNVSWFAGSHNVTFLVGNRRVYDASIYVGMNIGIRHKIPKDRDLDKVSDAMDRCPDDPGTWKYKGCPDTDGDGLIDLIDHCIYDPGEDRTHGCPDRDKDGVIDVNDRCPDDFGLAVHYGCPDRDKDGVIDVADRCPDVPGIELNNGCPFENQGCCMDNDGDGISNAVDKCPEVSGSVYNEGCPIDSTNIEQINFDKVKPDVDPNHTNVQIEDTINNGSTDIEVNTDEPTQIDDISDIPIMNTGRNMRDIVVYFDHDQSYPQTRDVNRLNSLVESVDHEADNSIKFVVIGHTDNVGSDNYNLLLSRRRAETVKKHLISRGINASQIQVFYYGEWQPLHSNDNEEHKGINRRCEVKVMRQ